jgi:predicted Zn-dependent peptidase
MFTYAGTRPDLAQQTLEVTVGEIRRLAAGIDPDEMVRARTQLKTSLIMQGESTTSRAGSLAGDWYHLRRLRGLAEIADATQRVTVDDVLEYLHDNPADRFTVLVLGPAPVNVEAIRK